MSRREKKVSRFIEEYLIDLNATQAYLRAFPGKKETTARTEASKLLALPEVKAELERARKARSRRTAVSQDRIVRELARIAFSDLRHHAGWKDGAVTVKPSEMLKTAHSRALSELSEKVGKEGDSQIKIKLHDKVRALELLGRHMGMFVDRVQFETKARAEAQKLSNDELRELAMQALKDLEGK